MEDTISIEPNVTENLKSKRKRRRNIDDIEDCESSIPDYGKHYNRNSRSIILMFAIILVLLIFTIIFIIMYKDKDKKEIKSDPNKFSNTSSNTQYKQPPFSRKSLSQPVYNKYPSYYIPYPTQQQTPQQTQPNYVPSPIVEAYLPTQPTPYISQIDDSVQEAHNVSKVHEDDETSSHHESIQHGVDNDNLHEMVQRLSSDKSQQEMRRKLVKDVKEIDD